MTARAASLASALPAISVRGAEAHRHLTIRRLGTRVGFAGPTRPFRRGSWQKAGKEGRQAQVNRSVPVSNVRLQDGDEPDRDARSGFPELNEKGTSKTSTISVKGKRVMKLKLIGYWATTILVASELLLGGVTDLVHGGTGLVVGPPVAQILAHEGYPLYLLTILGVWKIPGGIALLVPRFPRRKRMGVCRRLLCLRGCGCLGHRTRR
jgi:hypothetical protein